MIHSCQLSDQVQGSSKGCDDALLVLPLPILSATLQRCGLSRHDHGSTEDCSRYLAGVQQLAYWLLNQKVTQPAPHVTLQLFRRSNLAEFTPASDFAKGLSWNQYRGY